MVKSIRHSVLETESRNLDRVNRKPAAAAPDSGLSRQGEWGNLTTLPIGATNFQYFGCLLLINEYCIVDCIRCYNWQHKESGDVRDYCNG